MALSVVASSCYFSPAYFFRQYHSAKNILFDAHEYYVKQTLRNRTYLCGANGKFALIIPVKHTGGKLTAMKDIQISYDYPWQRNHWRSITSAYRNAPYFEYYEDELAPFFFQREKFLFDLNQKVFQTMLAFSGITVPVHYTDNFVHAYDNEWLDLRILSEPSLFFEHLKSENSTIYSQVFEHTAGFIPGLSILDLLFNKGKYALHCLQAIQSNE